MEEWNGKGVPTSDLKSGRRWPMLAMQMAVAVVAVDVLAVAICSLDFCCLLCPRVASDMRGLLEPPPLYLLPVAASVLRLPLWTKRATSWACRRLLVRWAPSLAFTSAQQKLRDNGLTSFQLVGVCWRAFVHCLGDGLCHVLALS